MKQSYRPTTFDEIVGQQTEKIEGLLDRGENFLFYGPPGTGKTSTARVISRDVQGSVSELMEFNASDDRGIDTVREEIIPATGQTTLTGAPRVIFLDEMDSMTREAQQALRQPMERSDSIFVLACNDIGAVLDAVESRCQTFEFGEVPNRAVKERIRQIADDEGVEVSSNQLKTIVAFANGDVRSAIKRYQQVARGVTSDESETIQMDSYDLESQARKFNDQ